MTQFLKTAPYTCDQLTTTQHNQHWRLVPDHFDNSYVHLVFETFFDADGSGGAFLSEKTFKPIRHAQPFVVLGTPYTLHTLRELGYRTFDQVIENSYDDELDNTQRYEQLRNIMQQLNQQDLHQLYIQCREDIVHNQELFLASKYSRLDQLAKNLNTV
jgi:hypothetical protein